MQCRDYEPSQRHIWFHNGKQHRQNCFPSGASCPFLSHLLPSHVRPAARYTLSHPLCNRSRSILQDDKVCPACPLLTHGFCQGLLRIALCNSCKTLFDLIGSTHCNRMAAYAAIMLAFVLVKASCFFPYSVAPSALGVSKACNSMVGE